MSPLDLNSRLQHARAETDELFTHLNPAALYERPIAERHRMIFYFGHLEAFDWNQMKQVDAVANSPTPEFDNLFAFGIDPEPGQLPYDSISDWPTLPLVDQYNRGVRERIDAALDRAPDDIVNMMIEHRHMHAETFTYILHNLESSKKLGPREVFPTEQPLMDQMVRISAGEAILGADSQIGFGWDNEFNQIRVPVPEFGMTQHKISNGQWLDYMRQTGAVAPHYWFQQDNEWQYRGVFHDFPLPLSWPVYATWNQASAYARFRGLALPTEAQYDRAAYGEDGQINLAEGNFGYRRWDPVPVNSASGDENHPGVNQLVGNGWEWTSSVFAPFPGFQPRPTYPGYSANFFDNSHYVLKGASPRTSSELVRRSLRNWFRPDYPYVYATFHLVEN